MLEVKNLTVFYGPNKAVDDVSFRIGTGEIMGILGESGSGKSTIAHSILRLIVPPGKITSGQIIFNGQDLLKLPGKEIVNIRGAKISMIFQDPFSSLNPVLTVGDQIAETIQLHQGLSKKAAWEKAIEMLELVRIKDSGLRIKEYPHQFSGGMRQRVMIAMALACQPDLLIADEPTTALDVTIQSEILGLIRDIQREFKLGIIFITHNFGIIKALCQRVIVMHKGRIVSPESEYALGLIKALRVIQPQSLHPGN